MPDLVPDYIAEQALLTPQPWDEGGKVHNWRNYILDRTRQVWDTLSPEVKVALAGDADDMADRERWD